VVKFGLEVREGAGNSGKQTDKRAGDDVATACIRLAFYLHLTALQSIERSLPYNPVVQGQQYPASLMMRQGVAIWSLQKSYQSPRCMQMLLENLPQFPEGLPYERSKIPLRLRV
jgi:hypothetical protein